MWDVNDVGTMLKLWDVSKGAGIVAAGFACQPYSRLGDQRGGNDPRALCLRGILATAFYLQAHAIVLECVQPAATNRFVIDEIQHFLEVSGFQKTHCDLHLHDIWPCRRTRAWWLLTTPFLGPVNLDP